MLELIRKENESEDPAKARISNRPFSVDSGTLMRGPCMGSWLRFVTSQQRRSCRRKRSHHDGS